jgi:uncharacterized caspase-like protein
MRQSDTVLSAACIELGTSPRNGGNSAVVRCTMGRLKDRAPVYHGEGEYMRRCLGCTVAGILVREDWEGATRAAMAKLPAAAAATAEPRRPAAPAETAAQPPDPERIHGEANPSAVALVVGVESYRHVPKADFAAADARRFAAFAQNALGIARPKLLEDAAADRTALLRALRLWARGEIVPGESDVTFFFAGHGLATADGRQLYLLPADGAPDLLAETAVSQADVVAALTAAGARSITLILDTCYSGQARGGGPLLAGARPVFIDAKGPGPLPPNVTVLSAAAGNQLSGAWPEQKHGLFSYFLMKGLSGEADRDADHRITAGELHAYVADAVTRQAARQGREQQPQFDGDPDRVLVRW